MNDSISIDSKTFDFYFFSSAFSCEVAQFINLSIQECRSILERYSEEQAREVQKIKEKYVLNKLTGCFEKKWSPCTIHRFLLSFAFKVR